MAKQSLKKKSSSDRSRKSESNYPLQFHFHPSEPFAISFSNRGDERAFLAQQKVSNIRKGLLTYLSVLQELTRTHVPSELQGSLPSHLHKPARVLAAILKDGIVLRFDPQPVESSDNEAIVFRTNSDLESFLPRATLGLLVVANADGQVKPSAVPPPTLKLQAIGEDGSVVHSIVDASSLVMALERIPKPRRPANSLPAIELIRNQLMVMVLGSHLHNPKDPRSTGRSFTSRTRTSLPGFWDAVCIYQWADPKVWETADYADWAERHFYRLAFTAASSEYSWLVRASQAALQKHYAKILEGLDEILALDAVDEEMLQAYLY